MKKHKTNFYSSLREFARNEKGIYAVMTGLLGVPLIGYIAFVVDGTGMLLDKARLTQGLEQAVLFLVAEDNQYRQEKKIYQVENKPNYPTEQELEAMPESERQAIERFNENYKENYGELPKPGDKRDLAYKQYQRNIQMVRELVQTYYLPKQAYTSQGIADDYVYHCGILAGGKVPPSSQTESVGCVVNGNFDRPSWLYWGSDYKKTYGTTFDRTTKVAADTIFVTKKTSQNFPMDVMFVMDFSGSMIHPTSETNGVPKIDVLRDVFNEISSKILEKPKNPHQESYNRIGFVDFAGAAQVLGNQQQCVFPFKIKDGSYPFNVYYKDDTTRIEQRNIKDYISELLRDSINVASKLYYKSYNENFRSFEKDGIDYVQTLNMVDHLNGESLNTAEMVKFDKNVICLGSNKNVDTTKAWYKVGEFNKLYSEFSKVQPVGSTLASSGLIIGANLLMRKNQDIDKITSNIQRSIIIFSDGFDTVPYTLSDATKASHITETLLQPRGKNSYLKNGNQQLDGLCDRIRKQVDSLQDDRYPKLKTKISFVSFGLSKDDRNQPDAKDQMAAWKHCVGEKNYYEVNNREQLLEVFKKATGLAEEVGRATDQKPIFK